MGVHAWIDEINVAVTVCDVDGVVLEMNHKAAESYAKDGGMGLIGTNLLDCHPSAARQKLEEMMATQSTNVYTIEKNGKKKYIYQAPWYEKGVYRGFIEMMMEIPFEMPHFVRGG